MIEKYLIVVKNPLILDWMNHIVIPGKYSFESERQYRKWKRKIKKSGLQILSKYKHKPLDGSPLNLGKDYKWWDEI